MDADSFHHGPRKIGIDVEMAGFAGSGTMLITQLIDRFETLCRNVRR